MMKIKWLLCFLGWHKWKGSFSLKPNSAHNYPFRVCTRCTTRQELIQERMKYKKGFYHLYSVDEIEPVLVHGYKCTDLGGEFVFGFNTHDGGGLVLLSDLSCDSQVVEVKITEKVVMNRLDDFYKCINETIRHGRTSLSCKLGLWSVESEDSDSVYLEAFSYWNKYAGGGEYSSILGVENKGEE